MLPDGISGFPKPLALGRGWLLRFILCANTAVLPELLRVKQSVFSLWFPNLLPSTGNDNSETKRIHLVSNMHQMGNSDCWAGSKKPQEWSMRVTKLEPLRNRGVGLLYLYLYYIGKKDPRVKVIQDCHEK